MNHLQPPLSILMILATMILLAACAPEVSNAIVSLEQSATPQGPRVIYVTPTRGVTPIPTVALPSATPIPTETPIPTSTPDFDALAAACSAQLETLYASASEHCLSEPVGYFCNGGLPPAAQPDGPGSSLGAAGALVQATLLQQVESAPLLTNNSGGLVWMRIGDFTEKSALLIGHTTVRDITPAGSNLPAWRSMMIQTHEQTQSCPSAPRNTVIVQGPYGNAARIVINGVSLDLRGTVAVQTSENMTHLLQLEGETTTTTFGLEQTMVAGQQIDVGHQNGDFTRPFDYPAQARPLDFARMANLPIMLMDRPALVPQPGYAFTEANVNMRAEPDEAAALLYTIPANQTLSILGMNNDRTWYHVRLGNGETGWMRADLLRVDVGEIVAFYDATPVPPSRYGSGSNRAVVSVPAGGNIRTAPHVSFPAFGTLPQGYELEVLAQSPYSPFVKVNTGSEIGWMALITLETAVAVNFLPIDYNVPLPPQPTATPVYSFGGGHAYPDPRFGQ